MKTQNKLFLIGTALMIIFSSCSVEKRKYFSGYNIQWNKNHQRTTNIENEKSDVSIQTEQSVITRNEAISPLALRLRLLRAKNPRNDEHNNELELTASNNKNSDFGFTNSDLKKHPKIHHSPFTIHHSIKDSCDVIILKNGNEIKAKVLEIGVKEISYKNCDNISGPTISVAKPDVFMVKYTNGTRDVFASNETQISPTGSNTNAKKTTNGLAVASLVTAILVNGVLAIVLGIMAQRQIKENPEKYDGMGIAKAGVIVGIIRVALFIAYIALLIFVFSSGGW